MWWSKPVRLAALAVVVAGCGFRPLYAPTDKTDVLADFSQVEVALMPNRSGQELRNDLRDLLTPRGQPSNPRYRLSIDLRESITKLAVLRTGLPTRGDLRIIARYSLVDESSGETVLRQSSSSVSSYNLVESDYSTLIAERYARSRALDQIADDIRSRLAVYFSAQRETAGGAPG